MNAVLFSDEVSYNKARYPGFQEAIAEIVKSVERGNVRLAKRQADFLERYVLLFNQKEECCDNH